MSHLAAGISEQIIKLDNVEASFEVSPFMRLPTMFNNGNGTERPTTLQWRRNRCSGVSKHQSHHCLLNHFWGAGHRKHQSSASLAFVRGIHQWPVNSQHKLSSNVENVSISWRRYSIVNYARGPIHSDGHVSRVSKPNTISWITRLIAIFRITPYRGNLPHNGVYGPQCIQFIISVRPSARGFGFIEYIDMVTAWSTLQNNFIS